MSYNLVTIKSNELLADGSTRLIMEFTGDAGEPARSRPFSVSGLSTMLQLRQWAQIQLDDLNLGRTVAVTASLQIGQTINPAAATAPTTEQIWLEKARRLLRATQLGLTNATAVADVAALRADVNATYLTAYIAKV